MNLNERLAAIEGRLDALDQVAARVLILETRGERRRRQRADARLEQQAEWARQVDAAAQYRKRPRAEFKAPEVA